MIGEYELVLDIWYGNLDHQWESDVYFRYLLEAPIKSQSQFGGEIRLQSKRRDFLDRANIEETNSKDPKRGIFFQNLQDQKERKSVLLTSKLISSIFHEISENGK